MDKKKSSKDTMLDLEKAENSAEESLRSKVKNEI